MLRNSNDLIVNSVNITPYLTNVKFSYNKIWAKDTGRNTLSGKYTGTLIGIFPKITCTFRKMTQSEIEELIPYLDSSTQSVTYYDPNAKTTKTITTYTSDYELSQQVLFSDSARKGEPFTISFIATEKRS